MTDVLSDSNVDGIIILSFGYNFCVCVCKHGVFSWGWNCYGQLGLGDLDNRNFVSKILFFQNPEEILSVSCGTDFCICVCKNGIFSWGDNNYGQLGIGNNYNQSSPQQILFFKNPEEIISVSCGYGFCVCVCKNGIFSWGNNLCGQLGIGNEIHQSSPQQILFFENPEEIISFSCGSYFCVCVCKNGVFSWGQNCYGQLGIGNQIQQSSPQKISFFEHPEEIISLCCGTFFSVCICKNGVFSWGQNCYGQLGIGNENQVDQSFPQQINFFQNPNDIISFSCSVNSCTCICDNEIFIWGRNEYERFSFDFYSPHQIFLTDNISSFSNLSFPQYSTYYSRYTKKLLFILAREYLDSDQHLLGKYYLPLDMFKILIKFI